MPNSYVEIQNLKKVYPTPKGEYVVVDDFDLEIEKGEFVSIIGHSGCGKSTVLMMLAGLTEISGGNICLNKKEIKGAGLDRAVVFQSPSLLPWMTAFENVMLGVRQAYPHGSNRQRRDIWLESPIQPVQDHIAVIDHQQLVWKIFDVGQRVALHRYESVLQSGFD